MTAVGALLAALAVGSLLLALRPTSSVARVLRSLSPRPDGAGSRWRPIPDLLIRQAGVPLDADRLLALKIGAAFACAVAGSALSLVAPFGPLVSVMAGYAGFVAPSLVVERRAMARRAKAERQVTILVERLEALVLAGRPPETALAALLRRPTGAHLLDLVLHGADEAYRLGAPLFRTLAARAREEGLATCAQLADDLDRSRDLGVGSIGALAERKASLRAAERARRIEAASQVEGKLMLTLVLCYLPALILLVVVPLFVGLLGGLLG